MSRSLKYFNRLLAQCISLHRRGYAIASDVPMRRSGILANVEDKPLKTDTHSAWAPDPVTGYYRPINHTPQIDPVDLRNMLLNHNHTLNLSSPH
ncbi:hypothetical protein Fmac_013468 [Flemingia macrophylla]|uniref:Late embryogenesis abundant protein Lea5 n=1 Tax=Flemingia macrophylla TaxID=520843 RepID=A0ABD1MT79_9FABA